MSKAIKIIFAASILVLIGALVYVFYKPGSNNTTIENSTATTSNATSTATTTTSLPPDEQEKITLHSKYYDVVYSVPKNNQVVSDVIKSGVEAWYKDTNIKTVTNDAQAENNFGIFAGGKYDYNSEYKRYLSDEYVSYVETVYSFTGGAHGSTNVVPHIYTKSNNTAVKDLSDIYKDSIYGYLSTYARNTLPTQLKKNGVEVKDIQEMFNDGTSSDSKNWKTFYFDGNNLVIVFGQYAIGPYVIGITELRAPLASINQFKK